MSHDDYTPARLRELADVAFDTEFRVLQAALRAAADQREADQEQITRLTDALVSASEKLVQRTTIIEASRDDRAKFIGDRAQLRATLAAREALLARCEPFILACVTWSGDADECDRNEAKDLTAEIAAALEPRP